MPSSEDQFADEMITVVRDALGWRAKRLDGFALEVNTPDGQSATVYLRNIYADVQHLYGQERAARLRGFLLGTMTADRPAAWYDAAPRLLPAVRPTKWANVPLPIARSTKLPAGSAVASVPFCTPLAPFVKVVCAIDSELSMSFATEVDLAAWDVTGEEALRTAIANLAAKPCEAHRNGAAATIDGPDGYASSWLAAPAALSRVAMDIASNVVAVALGRDELVLVDTDHYEATAQILGLALEQYQSATRQLSPVPYLVTATGVEPWTPPAGHPAGPAVDMANHVLAAVEYDRQKDRLDVEGDTNAYVAMLQVRQRPDGPIEGWAVWNRQVDNGLLPRADMIMFIDNENDSSDGMFAVRWDDALRLAAHALSEDPDYDPPRWRYHGWPDANTLAELRAHATPIPS